MKINKQARSKITKKLFLDTLCMKVKLSGAWKRLDKNYRYILYFKNVQKLISVVNNRVTWRSMVANVYVRYATCSVPTVGSGAVGRLPRAPM